MAEKNLEALRFLPRRRETWQGGVVRMPVWITEEGPEPFRPWGGVWVSLGSPKAHMGSFCAPDKRSAGQALEAFLELALDPEQAGYLPDRLEVIGEDAAELMERTLAPFQVTVTRKDRVHGVETLLDAFAREGQEESILLPGVLEPPGMSVERVASFAEAAELFYRAAPWRHLSNEDLLRIEAKGLPAEFRHALVMGAGGQEYGLLLFERSALFEAMLSEDTAGGAVKEAVQVTVFFGPIHEMPLQDADLMMDHRLSVAGPEAYPWAARLGPKRHLRRLSPSHLGWVEAVLRALAATTEAEMDRGRWSRPVQAPDGAVEIALALPDLAEPPAIPPRRSPARFDRRTMERTMAEIQRYVAQHPGESIEKINRRIRKELMDRPIGEIPSSASTPAERAQEICYQACEARGRRRVLMAREALAIDPDCAEAYVILAEQTGDPGEELRLYGEGVAAGERALGPRRFEEKDAPFWGDVTTRPFMRALQGLADSCADAGRPEEAISHYRRLLALNPNDNQGVRCPLVGLLLQVGDAEGAGALLKQYEGDDDAIFLFAEALWEFRRSGDSEAAREALREAIEANRHVPDLFLGRVDLPPGGPSSYTLGSVEEAEECALFLMEAWESTPGALEWLERTADPPRPRRPKRGGRG